MENQNESVEVLHDVFAQIISESQDFAVDFDAAWQWVGFSSKQKAREMLEKNFLEGDEYLTSGLSITGKVGQPSKQILLTVDCFKAFCMLAQTERGKQVRRYYIRLEKELHVMKSTGVKPSLDPVEERRQLLAQIKHDEAEVRLLETELLESNTYLLYIETGKRLAGNKKRLTSINSSTVTQLNWLAEQASHMANDAKDRD